MSIDSIFTPAATAGIRSLITAASDAHLRRYPGPPSDRTPVHVVYGGAHLFRADSAAKLGRLARLALETYAPDSTTLAKALGSSENSSHTTVIYARVTEKLDREPVEDFRIDFEDGYGNRADDEEDGHAVSAALELAKGLSDRLLPAAIGIRIKPLTCALMERSIRTLDIFLRTLARAASGSIPESFVVTLPKVVAIAQVQALADLLEMAERALGLTTGALKLELMVETPQAIVAEDGSLALLPLVDASGGRCVALHFGPYDYTAAFNITAACQRPNHPACDFARHIMQVSFAGTGVRLCDGPTTILPVPVHRGPQETLTAAQRLENCSAVHRAWRLHHDDVRRQLEQGFYQGWDLHPAQLVSRYAAVFGFFLEGLDAASDRMRAFLDRAAQATLVGNVFDDAATGQGLMNYFLQALGCGALAEDEVARHTGLTPEELRGRSFLRIVEGRRGSAG